MQSESTEVQLGPIGFMRRKMSDKSICHLCNVSLRCDKSDISEDIRDFHQY